ncbi:MAG: 3-hydroxybutyryl-CoA dehydratase [Alphaproteobacteria bacterium]|nr:3-hydroxybutyryl-CoA dehydratase [Alphaproteobacteria bacterium]
MTQFEKILTLPPARGDILVEEIAAGVVQLRINRPERMNALGVETTKALRDSILDVLASQARVLVIRGTGKAFSAGADLKERKLMDEAARFAHNRLINAAVNAVDEADIPTIAALNGFALGGGCELALACDMRFAVRGIQIGLTEARIGAFPGAGGTQRLPRLIGVSRAMEMILSGEPVSAERAAEIGLVNQIASLEDFDAKVARFAGLLASRSPSSTILAKKTIRQGLSGSLTQGLEIECQSLLHVLDSPDYAEGLAAFAEKRPPNFASRSKKA